jgi:hypothetical protein
MKKILFFSRGRGHGHAIPDMAIADALRARSPTTEIRFASYSTGLATLRAADRPALDLGLPEANPFVATLLACSEAIQRESPDVVLAHEEFAAVVAARLAGVPNAFLSAWLPPDRTIHAEALAHADAIILLENPGFFPVPASLRVRPVYAGPVLRPMSYTVRDRAALREHWGWNRETFAVAVVPGGASPDAQAPMADLVLSAFHQLPQAEKRLVWVASGDYDRMAARLDGQRDVSVQKFVNPIEKLLGACDLVVTKGTRGITLDAAAVGIPSLSISHGQNPVDDVLVPRMRTNVALVAGALDPDILASYMQVVAAAPRPAPAEQPAGRTAIDHVVAALLDQFGLDGPDRAAEAETEAQTVEAAP